MENLKAQGTKAFIWDFTGNIFRQGMGFIISIFLARILEPSDFGLIAMVMVIIGIAGVFTDVGLGGVLDVYKNPEFLKETTGNKH